ncbi:hypothetical protein EV127DRAFT_104714 [Xylaria flabelliformis]|nr:hypothetical protein EV127DRAFT_104714 [Xylaria flabelliformis]
MLPRSLGIATSRLFFFFVIIFSFSPSTISLLSCLYFFPVSWLAQVRFESTMRLGCSLSDKEILFFIAVLNASSMAFPSHGVYTTL